MHFEHLVEINDLDDTPDTWMTQDQLWRGLVVRAQRPADFVLGLERLQVLDSGAGWMRREFYLGNLLIRDRVLFEEPYSVRYETESSEQHGGGLLVMRIEQTPSQLFVRFTYDTSLDDTAKMETDAGDAYFASYVKAAYREADVETVRKLRYLAKAGMLGS